MAFNIRKMILSKSSSQKKGSRSAFIPLYEADLSYAIHSTDPDDVEAMKKKAYDDKRARQAEEYLAKYGFSGGIGGNSLRGLR